MALPTTPRVTRSSVLGKRAHRSQSDVSSPSSLDGAASCDSPVDVCPPTPETPIAKRPRTSSTVFDGDGNKENVPPFRVEGVDAPSSSRSLRRTSTEVISPMRSRATPHRRRSSMSQTTVSAINRLAIQTPPATPSSHRLPLHARARALLRATCNSAGHLAGRVAERATVRRFLSAFFASSQLNRADAAHPVLYISGSPGCGKTALVNSILIDIEVEMFEHDVSVVVVNCMALNGLDAVWDRLLEELGGSHKRGNKAKARTSDLVQDTLARRETKCILVLDEIDQVATSSQALASLFSLAHDHAAVLRIVGIANTHTLTSSKSQLSMHGLTGVKTVHFSPYEPAQLLEILQARLKPLTEPDSQATEADVRKFLPVPTLTFLSQKIATQTGDVRALFEVLRGAIDLANAENFVVGTQGAAPPSVTPSHILAALNAYAPVSKIGATPTLMTAGAPVASSTSEIVLKVRNLGLQARLVLLAFLLACKRVQADLLLSPAAAHAPSPPRTPAPASASVDTNHLHAFYTALLARGGIFVPVSRSDFADLAGVLETVGLVALSASGPRGSVAPSPGKRKFGRTGSFAGALGKGAKGQEVQFVDGIRADEVLRGLGVSPDGQSADVKDEEISAIWEREMAKIRKEAKVQVRQKAGTIGFDGAMED